MCLGWLLFSLLYKYSSPFPPPKISLEPQSLPHHNKKAIRTQNSTQKAINMREANAGDVFKGIPFSKSLHLLDTSLLGATYISQLVTVFGGINIRSKHRNILLPT